MSPEQLLAAMLFSETKDVDDAKGIASVVINRTNRPERFGATMEEVITAPSQFSGINSPEFEKAASGKFVNKEEENIYKQFLSVAYQATQGKLEDTTAGADHYVNLDLAKPNWSKVYPKTTKIGSHTYFKEKIIRK